MMLLADLLFVSLCILGFITRVKELNPFSTSVGGGGTWKLYSFFPFESLFCFNCTCIYEIPTVYTVLWETCIQTARQPENGPRYHEIKCGGRWWDPKFWVNSVKRGSLWVFMQWEVGLSWEPRLCLQRSQGLRRSSWNHSAVSSYWEVAATCLLQVVNIIVLARQNRLSFQFPLASKAIYRPEVWLHSFYETVWFHWSATPRSCFHFCSYG